jgi:hypothetical protein
MAVRTGRGGRIAQPGIILSRKPIKDQKKRQFTHSLKKDFDTGKKKEAPSHFLKNHQSHRNVST